MPERTRTLQRERHIQLDKVLPVMMHRPLRHFTPAISRIKRASGLMAFVRREDHPAIPLRTRKTCGGVEQLAPQPAATHLRAQLEQAQSRRLRILAYTIYRSYAHIPAPRDPSTLHCGVVIGAKRINNLPDQHTKTVVKPRLAGVNIRMGGNDPVTVLRGKGADFNLVHGLYSKGSNPCLSSAVPIAIAPIKQRIRAMGINDESDIEANLQIGPTDKGMVRLFIEGAGIEIPMDFTPDEAREIAEEIMSAAKAASQLGGKKRR